MKTFTCILLFFIIATLVMGDVHIQCGRGANNRHSGTNREVNNNQRMYNSQNNNRAGYNVGNHAYYEGSILNIDWTAQHSCGNANNRCEFIIQYMCDAELRDGTTDTTIPDSPAGAVDPRYGRHESYESYQNCKRRSRNTGLYVSNQINPQNNNQRFARFTRQNAGGTRYGYECPEERDYYPNWHPSPWIDVAVITNEPQRCDAYQAESQNVKSRYYCHLDDDNLATGPIPITQDECLSYEDQNGVAGVWKKVDAWNVDPPVCLHSQFTRDNHLGNTIGGQQTSFNWTIPNHIHDRCVLRLRYNITTDDMEGFESLTSVQAGWDKTHNNGPLDLELYGFETRDEAEGRGYQITGNPNVDPFGALVTGNTVELQNNVNTNQYSRTFEDRTHRFSIKSREGLYPADAIIHNINVRGKRGNIVQTYPAQEYDFCPNLMDITIGDYVAFQVSGSNANPGNNDGNGRAGTDRSNVVMTGEKIYNDIIGNPNALPTYGAQSANLPAKISSNPLENFLGWDSETLLQLGLLNHQQFGGDMATLDDAGTYLNVPPKAVERVGIFNYLSTRNNNFSNRSQKGRIKVDVSRAVNQLIGWGGGTISADGKATIGVKRGVFNQANNVALTVAPRYVLNDYDVPTSKIASDLVYVSGPVTADNRFSGNVELTIKHTASPIADTYIAYTPTIVKANKNDEIKWTKIKTKVSGNTATATTDRTGVYVVRSSVNVGVIIGIVIACVVVVAIAIALVIYCKKKANADAYRLSGVEQV